MWRRRRGSFGRRGGFRWLTPNLWSSAVPSFLGTSTFLSGQSAGQVEPTLTPVIYGAAPFPGVNNASGVLSGTLLAERQYFRILRIVGRLHFQVRLQSDGDDWNTQAPFYLRLFWALIRWDTDELGVPNATGVGLGFFDSSSRVNQDERKTILAQDVWSRVYPSATQIPTTAHYEPFGEEPPLFSYIDLRPKRPIGNEQQLYLATTLHFSYGAAGGLPENTQIDYAAQYNLRPYAKLGR